MNTTERATATATAAQEAEFLACHDSLAESYRPSTLVAWREAAASEGERYSEAIRRGRAERVLAYSVAYGTWDETDVRQRHLASVELGL